MKHNSIIILYLLGVTACNNIKGVANGYIPYSEIPGNYSLENAKMTIL